jgi:hypothetical protein
MGHTLLLRRESHTVLASSDACNSVERFGPIPAKVAVADEQPKKNGRPDRACDEAATCYATLHHRNPTLLPLRRLITVQESTIRSRVVTTFRRLSRKDKNRNLPQNEKEDKPAFATDDTKHPAVRSPLHCYRSDFMCNNATRQSDSRMTMLLAEQRSSKREQKSA